MLTLKTNPYREMVQSAMWSQYSARLFANTNSKDELFILIRSSADWQNNKWVMKSHSSSSVLTTGWSNDCFFAFCKKIPFFFIPSNPIPRCLTHTHLHPCPPPPLFQLTVKSLVIRNRNDTPWVKVTLCQKCILWFLPGYIALALFFIQNQIRNSLAGSP